MKIRTITTGFQCGSHLSPKKMKRYALFAQRAKHAFERAGYSVQTVRLTTQPWDTYLGGISSSRLIKSVQTIESVCLDHNIQFVNLGTVRAINSIRILPTIISATRTISASATIGSRKAGVMLEAVRAAARAIREISRDTEQGYGNFRFAAIINCPPHIPFYPASYHAGKPGFSLGLECSDLVVNAFARSDDLSKASRLLYEGMKKQLKQIERIARRIERVCRVRYHGIDTSPAPSIKKRESIAIAFEKLLNNRFGTPGTLSIARNITQVIKSIPVKRCGYCGLMLPVLEDYGLAQLFSSKRITLDRLLGISSVCGTGLDCVPLPGSTPVNILQSILRDVSTLAVTLNKPLSARLFPVPGKEAGERTDFHSPYLVDCMLQDII